MAKDEKKRGFFSAFRKREISSSAETVTQPQKAVATPSQESAVKSEALTSSVSAGLPKSPFVQPAVADTAQSRPVDTVEAFKVLCQSLSDISASQFKIAEIILGMISNSLSKIAEGTKLKK